MDNRNDLTVVSSGEPLQVGRSRHSAVGVLDLAEDRSRVEASQLAEMDGRLRVASADEDPTFACAKGKHVAGHNDVIPLSGRVDQHFDGFGTVGAGAPGSNPVT